MNRLNGPGWRVRGQSGRMRLSADIDSSFSQEDFDIPPTPGPRSSISLMTPIPNLSDTAIRKRQSILGNTSFGQRMPQLVEMSPRDDDREEVVDSMRRYVRHDDRQSLADNQAGSDNTDQDLDQQLTELSIVDHDRLSAPKDDIPDKVESPRPSVHFSQALDLEPIISTLSSLHATSHAQSTELLHKLTEAEAVKAAERERLQDDKQQAALMHLVDIKTTIQHDWQELRSRDAERERSLRAMMEKVCHRCSVLSCPNLTSHDSPRPCYS